MTSPSWAFCFCIIGVLQYQNQRASVLKILSQGPLQTGRYLSDGRCPSWPLCTGCPFPGGCTTLLFTPTLSTARIYEWHIEPAPRGAPNQLFWMRVKYPWGLGRRQRSQCLLCPCHNLPKEAR